MAQRMAYGVYIFTIQNVSIKSAMRTRGFDWDYHLQYKMFLLNAT